MKDLTKDIATKLADHITVDGNKLTLAEGAYESTLPETITAEQAKAVHAHDKAYIPGFTKAAGEAGLKVLKDNSNFAHVTAETVVGNSNVTVTVERTAQVSAGPAKAGEKPKTREVHGYTTTRVNTKINNEVKHVRDHLAELAKTEL